MVIRELKLNGVNLVLVEQRAQVRNSLRMALNEAGIHNNNIVDGTELATLVEAVNDTNLPDIVICEADTRGGDVLKMFHSIRHNEVGHNPFLAIIAISWDPTALNVKRAAQSGADYLLAAPFSPHQVFERIASLIHHRPPFVVTGDYVGPDRRYRSRYASAVPLIDVPNSLRAKVMGDFQPAAFRHEIRSTLGIVNVEKMDRHAHRLIDLAARLADEYAAGEAALYSARLAQLEQSATELSWRARDDGLIPIAELCDAVHNVLARLRNPESNDLTKEVSVLKQVTLAVRGALTQAIAKAPVIHDIAESVYSRG